MLGVAILLTLKITDVVNELKKLPIPVDSPDYGFHFLPSFSFFFFFFFF